MGITHFIAEIVDEIVDITVNERRGQTGPCRFCVDIERAGIKRGGFSERVRVNSGGFGAAHTHIGHLWEYPPPRDYPPSINL